MGEATPEMETYRKLYFSEIKMAFSVENVAGAKSSV